MPNPPREAVNDAASAIEAIKLRLIGASIALSEADALALAEAEALADAMADNCADRLASANRLMGNPPMAADSDAEALGISRLTPSVALMLATADKRPSNMDRFNDGSEMVGSDRLATALSAADRLAMAPGAARSMPSAAAALSMALAFALTEALALADRAAESAAAAPGAPKPIPNASCKFAINEPMAEIANKGAMLMLSNALRLGRFALIDAIMDPRFADALALRSAEPIA